MSPQAKLGAVLRKYRDDPVGFNSRVLRRPPYWSRQAEIAESVRDYYVTVCFSGNAIGKDYLLGGLIPWWPFTRRNGLCIVTGVSQTLLGSVTWKEVRRAVDGSPLLKALKPRMSNGVKASPQVLEIRPGWHALGYSTTTVERASGQHAPELLAIMNEASGIEDDIYDAIDSLKYKRLVVFGNPIRADGRFIDLIHQADQDRRDGVPKHRAVNAIRIPSTESPHATMEESPYGLADATWLEAMARRYGVNSLWYKSHVMAEIPVVSADTLIPEAWLDWAAAQPGRHADDHHPLPGSRRISCDLGEGVGRDSSCIIVRDDRGILEVVSGSYLGLAEAANRIFHLSQKYAISPTRISYDRVGIGRDFHLHLKRMGLGDALGYAGAGKPLSGDFTNLRTEAAWKLRKRLDPEGADDSRAPYAGRPAFVIPPMDWWPRMREELKALTYSLAGRKTALLSKEDHCTVLGHSPDLSDALLQSFAW